VEVTGGDLRRAVGLLQCGKQLGRALVAGDVDELAGVVPHRLISEALGLVRQDEGHSTTQAILDWVQMEMVRAGYPAHQFIAQLAEALALETGVGEMRKAAAAVKLAEVDQALTEGADEHLQLLALLTSLHYVLKPSTTTKCIL